VSCGETFSEMTSDNTSLAPDVDAIGSGDTQETIGTAIQLPAKVTDNANIDTLE
jgi:hypothetical protein